jgi:hypothetical protein
MVKRSGYRLCNTPKNVERKVCEFVARYTKSIQFEDRLRLYKSIV